MDCPGTTAHFLAAKFLLKGIAEENFGTFLTH